MADDEKVTVYFFRNFSATAGTFVTSKRPGTLQAIERVKGEPLHETAHEIDAAELDGDEFQRKPDA